MHKDISHNSIIKSIELETYSVCVVVVGAGKSSYVIAHIIFFASHGKHMSVKFSQWKTFQQYTFILLSALQWIWMWMWAMKIGRTNEQIVNENKKKTNTPKKQ